MTPRAVGTLAGGLVLGIVIGWAGGRASRAPASTPVAGGPSSAALGTTGPTAPADLEHGLDRAWPSCRPRPSRPSTLIEAGGPFRFRQDGAVFENREGLLPERPQRPLPRVHRAASRQQRPRRAAHRGRRGRRAVLDRRPLRFVPMDRTLIAELRERFASRAGAGSWRRDAPSTSQPSRRSRTSRAPASLALDGPRTKRALLAAIGDSGVVAGLLRPQLGCPGRGLRVPR